MYPHYIPISVSLKKCVIELNIGYNICPEYRGNVSL